MGLEVFQPNTKQINANREDLRSSLLEFARERTDCTFIVNQTLELLDNPNCFKRECKPFHITASAIVVNDNFDEVALVFHKKHKMWVPPGGHEEDCDKEDLLKVAIRETGEETGIVDLGPFSKKIFDLRLLPFTSKDGREELGYLDITYVLKAKHSELQVSKESVGCKWIPISELQNYDLREEYQTLASRLIRFIQKENLEDSLVLPEIPRNKPLGDRAILVRHNTYNTGNPHRDLWRLQADELEDLIGIAQGNKSVLQSVVPSIDGSLSGHESVEDWVASGQEEALDRMRDLILGGEIPANNLQKVLEAARYAASKGRDVCVRAAASSLVQVVRDIHLIVKS